MSEISTLHPAVAIIESRLALPAVLLVAGSHAADGAYDVADALAVALRKSGHSVARVSTRPRPAAAPSSTTVAPMDGASSRQQVEYSIAQWRGQTDVTIVDVPALLGESAGSLLAPRADAIVLAIRNERAVDRVDQEIAAFLKVAGANILGAILTGGRNDPKPGSGDAPAGSFAGEAPPRGGLGPVHSS
jgi:hypothetical protein